MTELTAVIIVGILAVTCVLCVMFCLQFTTEEGTLAPPRPSFAPHFRHHRGYTVMFQRQDPIPFDQPGWYGKIVGIKDLVMVEVDSIVEMQAEAEAAIDDYIETCKELGTQPERPATRKGTR